MPDQIPPPGMAEYVGAQQPTAATPPPGMEQYVSEQAKQREFGGTTEQAKAAVEGALRGVTGGLSDVAETATGISTPERIAGRREANPWTAGLTQAGGSAALIAGTGGVATPVEGLAMGAEAAEAGAAAEAAAEGAGMAPNIAQAMGRAAAVEKAGNMRALGATALGYGVEGAAFGGANVITDMALGDPDLNAQKITAELGMGALLGGGLGVVGKGIESAIGKFGFAKGSLSDELAKIKNQELTEAETEKILAAQYGLKENIKDINTAAERLGKRVGLPSLPVTPGMASASPLAQEVEDMMVHGAPSFANIAKRNQFTAGYDGVNKVLTDMLGEAESEGGLSKAQLGQALQNNLTAKLTEESAPINQLYNHIKSFTAQIPLSEKSLPRISENIMDLDPVRLDPEGPAAKLAERMGRSIENIKTVDDVKSLRKVLSDSLSTTASPNERFVIGQIQDRLKDLEDRTILNHAGSRIADLEQQFGGAVDASQLAEVQQLKGLIQQKKDADTLYKPFISKVKTLAEKLGKKNIAGTQSAIHFIQEQMTPESVAQKLFSKGDSEFAGWFSKNFPHEFELIKHFERASLRDSSVIQRTGEFDARTFLKKVWKPETTGGMAPERRNLLFSPDELEAMKDSQTYLRSIPEDFNPSHTSHGEAMRAFFEHPIGAAVANLRDFGMDRFLNAMTNVPAELRPPPAALAADLSEKFNNYNAAQKLIDKTDKAIKKSVNAIFNGGRGAIVGGGLSAEKNYADKERRVAELSQGSEALASHVSNHIHGTSSVLPNISQSFATAMTTSAAFLESKRPKPGQQYSLSSSWQPTEGQKAKFERYYDAVNNPVGILNEIGRGTMTPEALEAVGATHPDLLNEMRSQIEGAMDRDKAMKLAPPVKSALAKFLGRPLNNTMTPQVILANQSVYNPPAPQQAQGNQPRARSTQSGLAKLNGSKRMTTETNVAEEPV